MKNENSLPIHEWLAIVTVIGILLGLSLMAVLPELSSTKVSYNNPHYMLEQEIEIVIKGAVQNPGPHQVKRGALIKDVIDKAVPLPNADLSKLKLDKKVRKGQVIKVPEAKVKKAKKKKTIKIKSAPQ